MSKRFVDHIAEYIESNDLSLEHLTIVLPSERAKKYISSALYELYQKPLLAPKMVTIDQWVKSYSPLAVIDSTRALIRLFEIQLKHAKTIEDASFDEFFNWGLTLLSDFNEIDRYMLDANQVFKNLADIKEIENWSFGEENLTASQLKFMEFWDRLPGYYHELNTELDGRKMCYSGKAYGHLATNINELFEDEKSNYMFAGFNALSASELAIMRQLNNLGRAHILVDADEFYYKDSSHEAGTFLRELSKTLDGKKLGVIQDELAHKSMEVTMVSSAQKTGQAKIAATILEESTLEELDNTVLLLADETLIDSVLKNLPKSIGKANITLGLPIRNTSIKTWVDLLFSIQENKKRFKTEAIYFYDLQSFWNHPFVNALLDEEELSLLLEAERKIIKRNSIFISLERLEIGTKTREVLDLCTTNWNRDWALAMSSIRKLNASIYKSLETEYAFERAMLEAFDYSIIELQNIIEEGFPEMSIKSFRQLFNQHWGSRSIAYHGNPMDGLQIMGLLETRALDFKRVIALGMNEGNLPPTNPIQTMIPIDLRRYLGLPTPREKQGLFAHHFYRLLHHCEELFVTYSSADESIGSNEPSRYLLQLEMELSRVNTNINISEKIYSLATEENKNKKKIEKTPEIVARMDELFAGSTSASMIKKYLACPLDFYFRYVMDFGEAESIEEEIEHSTFGTFIHDTLEELYTPFARCDAKGNKVNPAPTNITSIDIDRMLKDFRVVLTNKFMLHFNNDREAFTKGKNLLSYQMAQELTERFLKSEKVFLEKQSQPVFIEALEQEYSAEIEISVRGEMKKVRLRGFIDRIDRIGETIRIIDYKSGKVDSKSVDFPTQKNDCENVAKAFATKKHILQLSLYAYLYHHKHGVIPQSSIISFISGNNEPFTLDTKKLSLEEVIEEFPNYIGEVLNSVYDVEEAFEHDSSAYFSFCQYCD